MPGMSRSGSASGLRALNNVPAHGEAARDAPDVVPEDDGVLALLAEHLVVQRRPRGGRGERNQEGECDEEGDGAPPGHRERR